MITYWFIFFVFAFAALIWHDQRSLAQPPMPKQHFRHSQQGSVLPFITGLFLILIIGLRYRVGGDWATYQQIFSGINGLSLSEAFHSSQQELLYTFFNWISSQVGGEMWLVNTLSAIPFTVGLIRLSRSLGNTALALTVATPFLIIVVGMGFTRQAAALGCLMYGISELIERKSLSRFIICVLIGTLFHRTVLILIPIILLASVKSIAGRIALAGVTVPIAYFTLIRSSLDRYGAGYIHDELDSQGAVVRVAMNVLAAFLLLASGNQFFRSTEEKYVWGTFAMLAVVAAFALMTVASSVIVDRLALYLIPLQLFVFTRLADPPDTGRPAGGAWRLGIIFYSASVLFVWLNYADHAYAWVPYRSYLTHGGS